jgi:hypothetical protein
MVLPLTVCLFGVRSRRAFDLWGPWALTASSAVREKPRQLSSDSVAKPLGIRYFGNGGMGEWLKPAILKTETPCKPTYSVSYSDFLCNIKRLSIEHFLLAPRELVVENRPGLQKPATASF